jgi:outer membrane protein assembly factor BamA
VVTYDRTGEFRLEYNVEYRFDLVGYLEGALFADAGNIWYWKEDPIRPGSGIGKDFINEVAVGGGIGLRFNFDFFIFRLDLGLKMRDPSLPEGQRWIFSRRDPQYDDRFGQLLNLNLGIGYPF